MLFMMAVFITITIMLLNYDCYYLNFMLITVIVMEIEGKFHLYAISNALDEDVG
jgi:hypothetical protein